MFKKLFKKRCSCRNNGNIKEIKKKSEKDITIKILGTGCRNCVALTENVKTALNELEINANIEKITDIQEILSYGIMSTPGLIINEKIISYGKVLKQEDIQKLIKKYLGDD